jgi:hypothetical protein
MLFKSQFVYYLPQIFLQISIIEILNIISIGYPILHRTIVNVINVKYPNIALWNAVK